MRIIIKTCAHCGEKFNATCGVAKFCSDRCHLIHNTKRVGGCLIWQGGTDKDGYGVARLRERGRLKAHRASYIEFVGPIPTGLMVCHTCDNPPCIEPSHLFLGTSLANKTDAVEKRRHVHGEGVYWKRKITDEIARKILASNEPAAVLAKQYGLHRNSIYYLRKRHTWKHLSVA